MCSMGHEIDKSRSCKVEFNGNICVSRALLRVWKRRKFTNRSANLRLRKNQGVSVYELVYFSIVFDCRGGCVCASLCENQGKERVEAAGLCSSSGRDIQTAAEWLKDKFRPATRAPVVRLPLRLTTEWHQWGFTIPLLFELCWLTERLTSHHIV